MKAKTLLLLIVALFLFSRAEAQVGLFGAWGRSSSTPCCIRLGVTGNRFGGEISFKSDVERLFGTKDLEGKTYRLSLCGGVVCKFTDNFLVTLDAGYGAKGTYKVMSHNHDYGAIDLIQGPEIGGTIGVTYSVLLLYAGYSWVISPNGTYPEFTFGIGLSFWD